MATEPTQELRVVVIAQIDEGTPRTVIRTVPIPPDYDAEDRKQFYGFVIERTAGELLSNAGWRRPRFRALMINAARLWLIEQLVNALPNNGDKGVVRAAILAILMRDDDLVLAEADLPPED